MALRLPFFKRVPPFGPQQHLGTIGMPCQALIAKPQKLQTSAIVTWGSMDLFQKLRRKDAKGMHAQGIFT